MFHENLRISRKEKGLSQEELAIRLNVVRQTISKWEKGLSVPDAYMLIKIAETLETSVHALLGAKMDSGNHVNDIAEQLSRINEQLAVKNRRSRRIWKVIAGIVIAFIVCNVLLLIFSMASFNGFKNGKTVQTVVVIKAPSEVVTQEE